MKSDGGPAFPGMTRPMETDAHRMRAGMSLRQWYAGMALSSGTLLIGTVVPATSEQLAAQLFSIADAMIAEGEKKCLEN